MICQIWFKFKTVRKLKYPPKLPNVKLIKYSGIPFPSFQIFFVNSHQLTKPRDIENKSIWVRKVNRDKIFSVISSQNHTFPLSKDINMDLRRVGSCLKQHTAVLKGRSRLNNLSRSVWTDSEVSVLLKHFISSISIFPLTSPQLEENLRWITSSVLHHY